MKQFDRSKITEEPIISACAPAYDDVEQFREWQRTNRINNPVIDAEKKQSEELTTRISLRRMK